MSKTPTKSNESLLCYSPKELATPNKENTEVSKAIFMHVSNLHKLLCKWVKLINESTKLCRTISALKLHECNEDYFPHQAKPLTEDLLKAIDGLKHIVESVEILTIQLKALARLQQEDSPVIYSWSASDISDNVSRTLTSIHKEYILKKIITENIAHCRDKNLMEVYVSAWEFNIYFEIEHCKYLFAETGLPGIT